MMPLFEEDTKNVDKCDEECGQAWTKNVDKRGHGSWTDKVLFLLYHFFVNSIDRMISAVSG